MTPPVTKIVKRSGQVVPFDLEKVTVAIYKAAAAIGGHNRELSERLSAEVLVRLQSDYSEELPPTVEDVQDWVERVLIKAGYAQTAKTYILYRHERARMRVEQSRGAVENIPYKAMWQMLNWVVDHNCHTVGQLNDFIESDTLGLLVSEADLRYELILNEAADEILHRKDNLRFIIVAGPSSSGKTTTTLKIQERLEAQGVHVIPMALDNYFFDLELHPRDDRGDYDFETPEAMDLPLLNEHLAALDRGEGIDMPKYDFKLGKRLEETTRFDPGKDTLILLDTLHGLYDGLTESVPNERKFRVYIETISQLRDESRQYVRWTDIRLLRRMIRDSQHRGYSPEATILHWHYVRRSELKHIIPFQSRADYVVNSSLAYELPFLKRLLFPHLEEFLRAHRNESDTDGYLRAERTHALLESIGNVDDDSIVPPTSLLREFIGGSAYEVH